MTIDLSGLDNILNHRTNQKNFSDTDRNYVTSLQIKHNVPVTEGLDNLENDIKALIAIIEAKQAQ